MSAVSMNELGVTLLWLSLQITALCVVAVTVYAFARRGNPKVGAAAMLSALLLISALSVAAFAPGPSWMDHEEVAARALVLSEARRLAGTADDSPSAAVTRAKNHKFGWFTTETASYFAEEFQRRVAQPVEMPAASWHWTGWLAVLFCSGLALGGIRLLLGLVSVARLRRSGEMISEKHATELLVVVCAEFSVTRRVTLCQSDGLSSAATIGWLRPLVLLPSDWQSWSREELRTVLAHEVAHIAHRDFPCWLLAQVGLLLHFYHPLVHWLAGRLRLEQELAADADAARHSGGAQNYLRNLAELAVRQADRPVAWPARTFLPSRGTLLRRVEMLRDRKANGASPGWRRGVTITALLLAGVFLSGIRQPGIGGSEAAAQENVRKPPEERGLVQLAQARARNKPVAKSGDFDLRYVPAASTMVIGVRPGSLADNRLLQPMIKALEKDALGRYGIKLADVEQFLAIGFQVGENGPPMGAQPVIILNLREDSKANVSSVEKGLVRAKGVQKRHNGFEYLSSAGSAFYRPNSRTLISGREEMVTWLLDATKDGPGKHVWSKHFNQVSGSELVYVIDMEAMKPEIDKQLARTRNNPMMAAFSPLWEETKLVVLGAGLTGDSLLDVIAVCGSEDGAKKVQQTAQSLVPLGRNLLDGAKAQMRRMPAEAQKPMSELIGFAGDALGKMKFTQNGNSTRLQVASQGESLPVLVALLLPAVQSAREAARRAQSMNNLKQIGLAFHNYHEVYKKFPGSKNLGPDGKTVHSWRVAILPFVDQVELHNQYKLDEPWDSEHNRKLLARMPPVFRSPNATNDATYPSYFGLTGASAGLGDGNGEKIRDFIDGTSNTILIVGAQREIPWTKPEDIPFDPKKDLPKFGGYHPQGFLGLLCDGSVRFLSKGIDEDVLKALLTRNGGEVVPRNFD